MHMHWKVFEYFYWYIHFRKIWTELNIQQSRKKKVKFWKWFIVEFLNNHKNHNEGPWGLISLPYICVLIICPPSCFQSFDLIITNVIFLIIDMIITVLSGQSCPTIIYLPNQTKSWFLIDLCFLLYGTFSTILAYQCEFDYKIIAFQLFVFLILWYDQFRRIYNNLFK